MVYGTPYHVGVEEDWEDIVAEKVGAVIGGHDWLDVEGVIFDYKHFVSGSIIPHGRATALLRENLWNYIWSSDGYQPDADVILRAHVHYHQSASDGKKLGVILPSLQGYGSKYGVRRQSGQINIGLVYFDCEKGQYNWNLSLFESDILSIAPKKA